MHPAYTYKSVKAIFITVMDQMTVCDVKRVTLMKRWHCTSLRNTNTFKCVRVIPTTSHYVCELTLKPETTVQDCVLTTRYF